MNFSVVIEEPEIITLHADVVTDDGIPLGGWVEMILQSNGNYTFHGSMEASGFPSYNYGLQVFIKAAMALYLRHFIRAACMEQIHRATGMIHGKKT
jgi:hypothetical protein